MAVTDKKKQSLYFPEEMLAEIEAEAARQDRSLSWIMQKVWKASRRAIAALPSMQPAPKEGGTNDVPAGDALDERVF